MKKNAAVVLLFILAVSESRACSGLFITAQGRRLFGLNEDYFRGDTIYRTLPATPSTWGVVAFGHSSSIQAMVNEKGLIYDGYGAPFKKMTNPDGLPVNDGGFIFEAMTTCRNVREVVDLYRKSFHPWLERGQAFFADRGGNSVIIEGDSLIYKTGDYQICTNFYQSDPESGRQEGFYPCRRYDRMRETLEATDRYSVDLVRDLLKSVHVEDQPGPQGPISTVYALVIDLNMNEIHVYNRYNYVAEVVLNITEELGKGRQNMSIKRLFKRAGI
ncbi:hypothetical protein JXO52_11015 [bacterium]|nr:hypothetical protein [bacterium]